MARRKSVAAQLYAAYKKSKRAKQQAELRAQRERATWERQQLREAEREEAQRKREAERAVRERARREAEKERKKERKKERDRARVAAQQRQDDAERKRAALAGRTAELDGILSARPRKLRSRSAALEQAFDTGGPAAPAALVRGSGQFTVPCWFSA